MANNMQQQVEELIKRQRAKQNVEQLHATVRSRSLKRKYINLSKNIYISVNISVKNNIFRLKLELYQNTIKVSYKISHKIYYLKQWFSKWTPRGWVGNWKEDKKKKILTLFKNNHAIISNCT